MISNKIRMRKDSTYFQSTKISLCFLSDKRECDILNYLLKSKICYT